MRVLAVTSDTLKIDTLSIVPGSVEVAFGTIQGSDTTYVDKAEGDYTCVHFASLIILQQPLPDCIRIRYTVFPYDLAKPFYRYDVAGYDSTFLRMQPYTIQTGTKQPYLQADGLDYSGSFARGISFGNNQDVVVNSTFNVQMNGKLQNDVLINASITDNNIPLQPDGNTQQLQEFDKVFITLSKDQHSLTMGDYELFDQGGYFMQFYKKMQGANYKGTYNLDDGSSIQAQLSAAVARGIHVRQSIEIIEGNQGPYKLKGNNGETFIIILAGTERIFMDGVQLVRGAEQDYVIDYNAGEITFMPRVLLTKDKRIYVEFEYAERQYFRTQVYHNSLYTSADQHWQWRLQVYSEQDSKNQPLDQTISAADRAILSGAGDSTNAIFGSGIDSIAFDAGRVLYKMIDSLGFDSVFVYSTNPDSAFYALTFTELGAQQGDYILQTSTTNGRVYKWVAPVDGIPQGTAKPVKTLIAPRTSQMITAGGTFSPDERTRVYTELALSNSDLNTFSETGNANNKGIASKSGIQKEILNTGQHRVTFSGDYEFVGKTFTPLERFRPVEFSRYWNILNTTPANEHYANAGLQYAFGNHVKTGLQSAVFIREQSYSGFMQTLTGTLQSDKWSGDATGSILQTNSDTISSVFIRPRATLYRTFPAFNHIQIGAGYEGEHNYIYGSADSLISSSFYFDQYKSFIKLPDSLARSIGGEFIYRIDKVPYAGAFALQTAAYTYSLQGHMRKKAASQLYWQAHYRILQIADTALTTLDPEQTLLGRVQHIGTIKKGLLTSDVLYEIGTGREQQRSYTYVETEPGTGLYTWNDYNGNGVQELDEFEIAVFSDQANFLQVFVPTDTYIQTNTTNVSYALGINPKIIWNNAKGLEGFISRFSAQSNLQLNRKVFDNQSIDVYNPFTSIADSLLVSTASYWVNTLYFNRSSAVFGFDYTYISNYTKQVITVGPERRGKTEHKITVRYRPAKSITLNGSIYSGNKQYAADAFTSRGYFIPYITYEPKLTYNSSGSVFRGSTTFQFTEGRNTEGGELVNSTSGTLDLRYSLVGKSTVLLKFSYVKIDFTGDADSPVGYAMLEGLQNGNNILWSLNYDRKLSQVVQLTAAYEGRKTGDNPITHIGRLQMRAVF